MAKTLIGNIKGPKGDTGDKGPQGEQGPTGATGATGPQGENGASPYELAVENGFEGTEEEWLASLEVGNFTSTVTGEIATATDSTDAPIIYLKENGYTEQFTTTGKNLLNPALQSNTSNGITFTKQSDGSYTMTGTQTDTSTSSYVTLITGLKLPIGRYKLSGGVNSKIYIRLIVTTDEENKNFYSYGEDFEFPIESENSTVGMLLVVTAGTTPQGTFYPMIRKAEITDNTYEPYTGGIASPNPDYPQDIVGMDNVSVKTCGKNLLEITANNITAYGITLTVNEDKSITLNGTSTQDFVTKIGEFNNSDDSYFMSGCPSGGSTSSYYLVASCRDENNTWKADDLDVGSGKALSNGYAKRLIQIGIKSGKTVSNLTFYPMIRNANVTDATYEPYTETVAEFDLTEPLYEGDYIEYRADGTGVLHRKMAKVFFDGSSDENWNMLGEGTSRRFAMTAFANYKDKKNTVRSSHFVKSDMYSWAGMPDCSCLNADNALGFKYLSLTTLAEWKAWLQSNPVTVVYELAEPTETPLTAEQVAEFMKLQTFKPVTNVLADGEVTVKYYCNNESGETVAMVSKKANNSVSKSSIANNLTTTTEGMVLDATQGKALNDKISTLNSNLEWKTLTHNSASVTRIDGDIFVNIITNSDKIKNANEVIVTFSHGGRETYIKLQRIPNIDLSANCATYIQSIDLIICVECIARWSTGSVAISCVANSLGLEVMPISVRANTIVYR